MKIAVLIPVYNAERFLHACLESVLAAGARLASASGGEDALEVFCLDDGSADASVAMLEEYARRSPVVHVSAQANCGVVVTRNRLMDALPSAFDAFAFVDSDDQIAPEMYAALAGAMKRTGADVAECGMPGNAVPREEVVDDMSRYILRRTAPGAWINVVNKLYRRAAVGALRFREGLRFEEDFFFNYEVHAQIRRKVILPQTFYTYRDNPDSATHVLDLARYFESTSRRIELSLETFLRAGRIPKSLETDWRAELSKDAYRMCVRKNLKKNRDAESRRALFQAAGRFFRELEAREGFVPTGLNPLQRAILGCCRRGNYLLARLLVALT